MNIVVAGASSGIGLGISQYLSAQGFNVVGGARRKKEENIGFEYLSVDLTTPDGHALLADRCIELFGSLDGYINNVGASAWRSLRNIDESFLSEMLRQNLFSSFWGCKIGAERMESGSIINMSSIAGKRGTSNNSVYVASKFGLNGMTQALAKELGPCGIRINAICPVLIETPGLLAALESPDAPCFGKNVEEFLSEFKTLQSPLGALPTTLDVARMVEFLLGEQASSITGQCINVDCGVLPG